VLRLQSLGGWSGAKLIVLEIQPLAFLIVWVAPLNAIAQERPGDAALGALLGAVVFGPIGAIAGTVVGYAAGPSIARSWGLGRSPKVVTGHDPGKRPANAAFDQGASSSKELTCKELPGIGN
jgi:hypothetical protein